jgi:hypothetical protein
MSGQSSLDESVCSRKEDRDVKGGIVVNRENAVRGARFWRLVACTAVHDMGEFPSI